MKSIRTFLFGVLVTLVGIVVAVLVYFLGGFAPVATAASPMPFEQFLAMRAVHARAEREMPTAAPIALDEPNELAGARVYVEHCALCHGLPGRPETPVALGEFPKPPQLLNGQGVTGDPAGETWWKVANGIRLSGMPAFDRSLSDTQIWQVSLFLANADRLPPTVEAVLREPPAQAASPPPVPLP
jgi:thiosulfate dehydrogenase